MSLTRLGKKSGKFRVKPSAPFGRRLFFSIFVAALPSFLLGMALLWTHDFSLDHRVELTVVVFALWAGLSYSTFESVTHSLRVLSNVIAALRDEDFSFRAIRALPGDPLGDLAIEINNLARVLETERLGAIETVNLLKKVMSEVEAVILAFSPDRRVRLVNRAGEVFLGRRAEQILGYTADELAIGDLLESHPAGTLSHVSSGVEKRWLVRIASFRQDGVPHRLVLLSEASEALRTEERVAWQRLVRVLGHEINNSLAPIKSIARTLSRIPLDTVLSDEARQNFRHGFDVIGSRAESLNRFLQGYAKLAQLPPALRRATDLGDLISHVVKVEARLEVVVAAGPRVRINVDPDQLEQALINLVRNAVDAVLMKEQPVIAPDSVTISWIVEKAGIRLLVRDKGIGLAKTENLFVPFYTTKESGSGIGLLLSRQIIEGHRGTLSVRNREDVSGCEVQVMLPQCVMKVLPATEAVRV